MAIITLNNRATNRSDTASAGQVFTATSSTAADFQAVAPGGITVADQWRLTTNFTGDANPLSSNLERIDTTGQGTIGSAMTVSSGIFTFPLTGIYLVKFTLQTYYNAANHYATGLIYATTNNSSYTIVGAGDSGHASAGANVYNLATRETLIDVTNTSNVKVKFVIDNQNDSTNVVGHSTYTYTNMMFIRLGDT